jgi:hypothetical protein
MLNSPPLVAHILYRPLNFERLILIFLSNCCPAGSANAGLLYQCGPALPMLTKDGLSTIGVHHMDITLLLSLLLH